MDDGNVYYRNRHEIQRLANKYNMTVEDASDYYRRAHEIDDMRSYLDWIDYINNIRS